MERELRNLASTTGPNGASGAVHPRSRVAKPVERLSVPGSTMLLGTFAGQPLTMPRAAAWKRRSELDIAAASLCAIGREPSVAGGSGAAAQASRDKRRPCNSEACSSAAAGSEPDAQPPIPAAAPVAAMLESPTVSPSPTADSSGAEQQALAHAALPVPPRVQAPPETVLVPTSAPTATVSPLSGKAAWWASRRCGGGAGAKCEAKDSADCQSRKTGEGAVGWQLDVYWPPDRRWFHAEVISYDPVRGVHEILYPVGSNGGAETELNVCLGSSRVHLISTTPTPLPWRFECACGVRFDHTDGINVDGNTCVQCYECERWMHGACVALGGLVTTPAYAHEAAKINAVQDLTGAGSRQQLCWLASERHFRCPQCTCRRELAPHTSVHAAPEAREEAESDAEEADVLAKNSGSALRIGELYPKRGSCMCVRPMCQYAQSRWGRASGAPAVACAQCNGRMHLHCSLRHLRLFHQRCAEAVAAGRESGLEQLLCSRCSDESPTAAAAVEPDSSSEEDEEDDAPSVGPQLVARHGPAPKALSSRVRLVQPCGSCYQCTHSGYYVSCARREDGGYERSAVLIPIAELLRADGGRGAQPLSEPLAKAILAPYGTLPTAPPERPSGHDPRLKIPSALAPSLLPDDVLRGIVHRVERAPRRAGAAGDAPRADVSVVVHFDHGAVVTLDERTFLRFAREPIAPLLYQSPAVRQLSRLDPAEREEPTGGPLRVLKELLRHGNYYHRLEVREVEKKKGARRAAPRELRALFARAWRVRAHRLGPFGRARLPALSSGRAPSPAAGSTRLACRQPHDDDARRVRAHLREELLQEPHRHPHRQVVPARARARATPAPRGLRHCSQSASAPPARTQVRGRVRRHGAAPRADALGGADQPAVPLRPQRAHHDRRLARRQRDALHVSSTSRRSPRARRFARPRLRPLRARTLWRARTARARAPARSI